MLFFLFCFKVAFSICLLTNRRSFFTAATKRNIALCFDIIAYFLWREPGSLGEPSCVFRRRAEEQVEVPRVLSSGTCTQWWEWHLPSLARIGFPNKVQYSISTTADWTFQGQVVVLRLFFNEKKVFIQVEITEWVIWYLEI